MKILSKSVIGDQDGPLMIRWVLFRCAAWGVYVHKFLRSDYDRALHDHPWPFVAIILKGGYVEVHDQTIDRREVREPRIPGNVLVRPAEWRHRIVVPAGESSWSLVIVGRRQRRWGFLLPNGWCHWRRYNSEKELCEETEIYAHGGD